VRPAARLSASAGRAGAALTLGVALELTAGREDVAAARATDRKGLKLLGDRRRVGTSDAKQREVLFGATQFPRRWAGWPGRRQRAPDRE
jgi:hypothetical protein